MDVLLAVDLGVKTGLALYSSTGKLVWFRSQNFGNASRLRKAIPAILTCDHDLKYLVVEGGGPLFKIWENEANQRNIEIVHTMAEQWRPVILLPREQRGGISSKKNAIIYAHNIIKKLADHRATSLTDDAAEAILIGYWAMLKLGWIKEVLK
jgi:hypothetical protein